MATATAARERPILFRAPMVAAILDGRKTVTRRPIRTIAGTSGLPLVPLRGGTHAIYLDFEIAGLGWRPVGGGPTVAWPMERIGEVCPYGGPGDRLWVREPWWSREKDGMTCYAADQTIRCHETSFAARAFGGLIASKDRLGDDAMRASGWRARPSIHLPRRLGRIVLEIVTVYPERVQQITEEDAAREGLAPDPDVPPGFLDGRGLDGARAVFAAAWARMYRAKQGLGWDADPWCWRVEFKVAQIDRAGTAGGRA